MEVEDGEGELDEPVGDLLFSELLALGFLDEVVHVAALAVAHDDVEGALAVDEGVAEGDDVDVLELFEQFEFGFDGDPLAFGDVLHAESFDDVRGVVLLVVGQEHVSVGSAYHCAYPRPISFNIL